MFTEERIIEEIKRKGGLKESYEEIKEIRNLLRIGKSKEEISDKLNIDIEKIQKCYFYLY